MGQDLRLILNMTGSLESLKERAVIRPVSIRDICVFEAPLSVYVK